MSRLIRAAAALCLGLSACSSGAAEPGAVAPEPAAPAVPDRSADGTRPDIIVINLDDADPSLIGSDAMQAHFPNMARLLDDEGLRFDRFYAADPLCGPSRASLLRGQYPHNTGITLNGRGPADNGAVGSFELYWEKGYPEDDLPVWLDDAGYVTALVGKYLHEEFPRATGDNAYVPPGWDDFRASLGGKYLETYQSHNGSFGPLESGIFRTDDETASAVEIIGTHAAERDLFLYLAPFNPHGGQPQIYADRHADAFEGATVERTPDYDEADLSDKPALYQGLGPLTEGEMGRFDATHRDRLRSLLSVDEMIGDVFAALEAAGTLDETYIFFTSDNGFQLGHHRMVAKNAHFERSSNVGLVARGPGIAPGTSDALLVHIDLTATVLDLADVPIPDFVDGRSFAPLLRGDELADRPGGILLEHREAITLRNMEMPQDYVALRRADEIYVEHENGEREWYDLAADPFQLENGYESLPSDVQAELASALAALKDCTGTACWAG